MLIGLMGHAGSGKSTVAEYIRRWADNEGMNVEIVAFADLLKESVAALFGIDDMEGFKQRGHVEVMTGSERRHFSGREILQRYGDEAHRQIFGENFWLELMRSRLAPDWPTQAKLARSAPKGYGFVVPDVRYENEAKLIKELGGNLWQINRQEQSVSDSEATHASESLLSVTPTDTINNVGCTLSELQAIVESKLWMKGLN